MKTFDTIWEQIHTDHEWGKYPCEEVIRFTARNYYSQDRSKINFLDFGCGTGAVTWFLAREGFNVYGFDGSLTAVKKAKKRLIDEHLNSHLIVSDGANLEYDNEIFDAVIDSAATYAHKSEDIKRILKEIFRVLKPGGKFFSTGLFCIDTTGYGTGEKLEDNTYRELTEGCLAHRGTVHFFDENSIKLYWNGAGFRHLSIDKAERTDNGGKIKISYYVVEAEK
ncbi:Methyltransferase domain-containing protein [Clostridium cavendishii DSM 21758]|uniref:Methyltransferase domain-containing protein n=1 Tax=Clostridium cavendishii DSM 21758 TaxID=1121302 RepID=A0A1M6HJ39_9CLOT|nr:methyltransferase domain-containing protein [Clostridium cavendishii]SHJ22174.1 Methyltransferase domain-containing protein [Clostridium cavendishii DSM 21758]